MQYTIRFIGRNAYLSDDKHNGENILSMDFKSVVKSATNTHGVDIDSELPIIIVTPERIVKILPSDTLTFQVSK